MQNKSKQHSAGTGRRHEGARTFLSAGAPHHPRGGQECPRSFRRYMHAPWAGLMLVLWAALQYAAPDLVAQTSSGVVSPFQSTAQPLGLNIVGPVMTAGSDAAAQQFQAALPGMVDFIHTFLPEYQNNLNSPVVHAINPANLTLSTLSNVRAYFAYEGAGYHNTIGFNTSGVGVSSGNPQVIFPDASSSLNYGGIGTGVRSASEPLLAGDFVNLGNFNAGTTLDFFLIANGAYGGNTVFSTTGTGSQNPDGLNHNAAFSPSFWGVANSPYVFIAFEDLLGGGDKDFNDTIIALNIGNVNATAMSSMSALLATPEPATWLTLGGLVTVTIYAKRRSFGPATVTAAARGA